VLSIRTECLRRVIPLGEHHLRRRVVEYLAHYHVERHHQGFANRLVDTPTANDTPPAKLGVEKGWADCPSPTIVR
jgi:hypothetical protein